MENKKKTVYYVCFYADPEFSDDITSYPSVWSKIDYVSDTLKRIGYNVCYVCPVIPRKGRFKKRVIRKDEQETHIYFSAFSKRKSKALVKLNNFLQMLQILAYLLVNTKSDDRILIYHSMYHCFWAPALKKIFRKKYILQIEDVYSALSPAGNTYEKKEWDYFETANGYLCVNTLIRDRIHNSAPKIISHGRYAVSGVIESKISTRCRLVYAGVIEQVRKGAFLAVETMNYLPENYELVILGFGNEKDICDLKKAIKNINDEKGWCCIKYLGYMAGEEYLRELQKCSIALSTHMYDDTNMKSADYTFPSKLLVYLGNGLHIVAQDLKCLRESEINEYITYYDRPVPQAVAKAITAIDTQKEYDSRKKIKELDREFCRGIQNLFE